MSLTPAIIYEDQYILVIDKPAGMPSMSLSGSEEKTLASWISKKNPDCAKAGESGEVGLVHRLDNDTSGVIVAARINDAYKNLRAQFEDGTVKKEYIVLVIGTPPKEGRIDLPIAHHPRKKKKMMVCVSEAEAKKHKARTAATKFRVIKKYNFEGARYSLLSVEIKTGVRHQIRAHLASIGHPIAGDKLYQNSKLKEMDVLNLKRHFLHASEIEFAHPKSGERVKFVSKLPIDLPTV